KVSGSPVCPRCLNDWETLEHSFRDCITTVEVWNKLNIYRVVGCTFWVLLTERNKYVHDGIKNQAQVIVERINAQLEELDALNKLLLVAQVEIVRWRPLENDFIKINFDGAFQAHSLKSCSGIRRQWRKIDGEQLGEYLGYCEMKIELKVLLGCSPIGENNSEW
ncbi:hypothetical protein Golob_004541, partial [Gossypium lobatum]|nr:hypothetical protein [Gossypium lobatum]